MKIKLNFTFKEIAIILGKTEEWARVNFYRTKIKIKEELKMKTKECNIVQDLLPNYIEGLVSRETSEFVKNI